MMRAKTEKIMLESYGSYLGMEKGCFIVNDKDDNVAFKIMAHTGVVF